MTSPLDDSALDRLFRAGRAYGHYRDEPVAESQLHAIWDLLKMGPTSFNQLPARLVWCVSDEAKGMLAAACSDANRDKVLKAPVSVVIGMDVDFHELLPELYPHADVRHFFDGNIAGREVSALRNSSLQGAYLILAARALGLDVGPMSGFDADAVNAAFFADTPNVRANFIATLGYGDPATLHPRNPRPAFERFNRIA